MEPTEQTTQPELQPEQTVQSVQPVQPERIATRTLISDNVSKRISVLRFPLIVLIVLGHNTLSRANAVRIGVEFQTSLLVDYLQLIFTTCLANCAVPLFFLFAAYLQAKKNYSYPVLLKKKARGLLIPYVLWLSMATIFVVSRLSFPVSDLKIADWATLYLGHAEWFNPTVIPLADNTMSSIQFWFIRDLMILVLLSPIFVWLIKKFPAAVLVLSVIAYMLPFEFRIVDNQAVFFLLGLYFGLYDFPFFEKIDRINWLESIVLLIVTCIAVRKTGGVLLNNFMVIAGCIFLLKLTGLIVANEKACKVLSYLSGFSFFLYAIHLPILSAVVMILWVHFFPMKNVFLCVFEYFGAALLISAIGTGIGIGLKKICRPAFALLTGGRI